MVHGQAQGFVAVALGGGQLDPVGDFGFCRQLGGHLFFGAAQQEGPDPPVQVSQALGVGLFLDRRAVVALEAFAVAKPAGHEEVEQRPELAQVVFQRCATQAQALLGLDLRQGEGGLAARVLDVLRFIENQQVIALGAEQGEVAGQQGVGAEDQVVGADLTE